MTNRREDSLDQDQNSSSVVDPPDPKEEVPLPVEIEEPDPIDLEESEESRKLSLESKIDAAVNNLEDAIAEVQFKADDLDEQITLNNNNYQEVEFSYPNYGVWMTGGAEGGFNGEVYDRIGLVDDGLTNSSRPWLRYDLSNRTVDEVTGPPPSSWGSNHLWKLKGHCKGAAYFF